MFNMFTYIYTMLEMFVDIFTVNISQWKTVFAASQLKLILNYVFQKATCNLSALLYKGSKS